MGWNLDDTIVAAATATGAAGLAVVRLCGPEALEIASGLFRGADLRHSATHRAHHGFVVDAQGERIDEVLVLVLRAPHGYTGEDTLEISCHGGPQIVDEIVATAIAAGARLAEPGEFTRRAFVNGKLDLSQAEAVADLVEAQTRAARRVALEQLRGKLSQRVQGVRSDVVRMLADIEASLDFVEEDIHFMGRDEALRGSSAARQQVEALLATADAGVILRTGIRISLAGAPNVGKSSLFNGILRSPRSIVTEHAGTTRDIVRETLRLGGVLVQLEDTAGLRPASSDPVESIGIERSRESHRQADVLLWVVDATRDLEAQEKEALAVLGEQNAHVAVNKVDLLEAAERQELLQHPRGARRFLERQGAMLAAGVAVQAVSSVTQEGIDALLDGLVQNVTSNRLSLQNDALLAINQRHREVLLRARASLQAFETGLMGGEPLEVLAVELRRAMADLGEISGEHVSEEILDSIFARFCIGK